MRRHALCSGLILGAAVSCSGDTQLGPTFGANDLPPVLANLTVQFAPWDGSSPRAGDFLMDPDSTGSAPVDLFAGSLGTKFTPSINLRPALGVAVMSPTSGIVVAVELHEKADDGYSIRIRPSAGSRWLIGVDHVDQPAVGVGDVVHAGERIGVPSFWWASQGSVDLQITEEFEDGRQLHHCPTLFVRAQVRDRHTQGLAQLLQDWERAKADAGVYDESSMVHTGCMAEQIWNDALVP